MKNIELKELIAGFEDGTYPKEKWTHLAHFYMALWYCYHFPLPDAVIRIRNGIRHYNEAVGGQNTDHSGYHETITMFYIIQVSSYLVTNRKDWLQLLEELPKQDFINKEFISQFYSKEQLAHPDCRKHWIAPSGVCNAR